MPKKAHFALRNQAFFWVSHFLRMSGHSTNIIHYLFWWTCRSRVVHICWVDNCLRSFQAVSSLFPGVSRLFPGISMSFLDVSRMFSGVFRMFPGVSRLFPGVSRTSPALPWASPALPQASPALPWDFPGLPQNGCSCTCTTSCSSCDLVTYRAALWAAKKTVDKC